MKDIGLLYRDFCAKREISFNQIDIVAPWDDTTLFCPAGMQQYKDQFRDPNSKGTVANIQACIRMNDYKEIGDGTHRIVFHMMGLFSFRDMSVKDTINFWLEFVREVLDLKIDYVTIHPDRIAWKELYPSNIEVRTDSECTWSDGEIGGYCTEFYVNGIEVGNIVNTNGDCIDVGFGLERLSDIVNESSSPDKLQSMEDAINAIANSGYYPGKNKQGYVLRKLLRDYVKSGGNSNTPLVIQERERQEFVKTRYVKLKNKYPDKTKEWWFETFGIDIDDTE